MKTKKRIIEILVPILVATGVFVFIYLPVKFFTLLGINDLYQVLSFAPRKVFVFVGIMNVLVFVPVFVLGFIKLTRKGAIGQAKKLKTTSVYKYVRNPMYAGVSFTIMGTGLILGSTGILAAGLLWLLWCFVFCLQEEKQLLEKFGEEYIQYRKTTPMFIPRFDYLLASLFNIPMPKKDKSWK